MSSSNSGSTNLLIVLFLIFLVLKLCGVIAWSWWWVTCPLWIGFAILFGMIALGAVLGGGLLGLVALFSKK